MCEQCSAATHVYGTPLDGIALVRATRDGYMMKKGQWGLVFCNDPFVVWDKTPQEDPMNNLTEEQIEAIPLTHDLWKEEDKWLDTVVDFDDVLHLKPEDGYRLIKASIEKGYDEKIRFSMWLFDYLGIWIKENPEPTEYIPQEINIDF